MGERGGGRPQQEGLRVEEVEDKQGARRTVVLEQLFDEVDVREDHAPTTITLQLQLVEGISTQ